MPTPDAATLRRKFQQLCKHEFEYTDGDEVHGRSYCIYCGLDGDA